MAYKTCKTCIHNHICKYADEELLEWLYADLDEMIDMVGDDDDDKLRPYKADEH